MKTYPEYVVSGEGIELDTKGKRQHVTYSLELGDSYICCESWFDYETEQEEIIVGQNWSDGAYETQIKTTRCPDVNDDTAVVTDIYENDVVVGSTIELTITQKNALNTYLYRQFNT